MFDAVQALRHLPYVPPMLLVDEVQDFDHQVITVSKMFETTDLLVAAHLVGRPQRIVPGVLLIEMVGQAALLHQLLLRMHAGGVGAVEAMPSGVLARCKATFHRPADAGKRLSTTARIEAAALGSVLYAGTVSSDGNLLAHVEVLAKLDGVPK